MFGGKVSMADRITMGIGKALGSSIRLNKEWEQNVLIRLYNERGRLKDERRIFNTTNAAAKNGAAGQCASTTALPKAQWMELGTGTSQGAGLLGAYISGSRTVCDSYLASGAVVTYITTFVAGAPTNAAIAEAGLFDVVTQNTVNMWLYATFGAIAKAIADSLVITWTLTMS
jgi:hypothetical protein